MADAQIRITAVDATRQAFDGVKRNLGDLERAATSARSVLAGIGVGLSGAAFVGFVRSSIDAADNLAKLSQRVGVTVESLSELQYAGKLSDVSLESLGDSLRKLSVNLQEGAQGSKEYVAAFKAVGISTSELLAIKPDEALARIAEAFAGMEDGAGKTALAVKLLGRAGADLIPLLNGGAAGLRGAADEARKFGLIVSTESAKAAEQFNDNMTRLGTATEAFGIQMANTLLPTLSKFVEQLLEGQRIFGSFSSALVNIGVGINPFRGAGENLKKYRAELADLQKDRERYLKSNADTAAIDQAMATVKKQIEFLQFLQRQQIKTGDPSTFDARDRALQAGKGKLAAPNFGSDTSARDKAIRDRLKAEEEAFRRELEFNKALSDEEIRNLERVSDAEQRLRDERDADLVARLQAGTAEAERQRAALAGQVDAIIGATDAARVEELQQQIAALNDRYLEGAVSLEKYSQARRTLDEQLADLANESRDVFPEVAEAGEDAFQRLEYAVQGWGRSASAEFARFIVDGEVRLDSFVKKILADIVQLQIQRAVVDPLIKAGSAAIGSYFSGAGASAGADLPGFAAGGPVSAGRPIIVGEKGPELFVPPTAGAIVPNDRLGGGVTIINNIDSRTDLASIAAIMRGTERRVYDTLARR